MKKQNLNVHYLTMSIDIFNQFCSNKTSCNNLTVLYGIKTVNGDVLEKYLELFLQLKVVITSEKYDSIDNLFYNIEYITYIFLGHGVPYIKSYLYSDYRSCKRYNKMLVPPYKKFIDLALKAGWKSENIIKIGFPRWDDYTLYNNKNILSNNKTLIEKSIFLMFTWRKVKKGKKMSDLYYINLFNLFNNAFINEQFQKNNIKLYFCYHHNLKEKRRIQTSNYIRFISQNDISILIKNSSLIITDFSSILFDAIVQKKPLILFIPDGLDKNLKDIYTNDYYETIIKLKKGMIDLLEIFFDLKDLINKIFYYIKNDFILEEKKLKFYQEFNLKNYNNTKMLINYITTLK